MPGASSPEALAAVLTVLPLDTDTVPALLTMAGHRGCGSDSEAVADFATVLSDTGLADSEIGSLERNDFYERAARALAIVRTGDLRPYGNILLVKGVVNRYERAL